MNPAIDYHSKPILTARETARYLGMPESTLDVGLLDRVKSPRRRPADADRPAYEHQSGVLQRRLDLHWRTTGMTKPDEEQP